MCLTKHLGDEIKQSDLDNLLYVYITLDVFPKKPVEIMIYFMKNEKTRVITIEHLLSKK